MPLTRQRCRGGPALQTRIALRSRHPHSAKSRSVAWAQAVRRLPNGCGATPHLLPCLAMRPRRTVGVVTMLGLTSILQWSCTGSTHRDQNFGSEAGADFEAPLDGVGGAGVGVGGNGATGTGGATG